MKVRDKITGVEYDVEPMIGLRDFRGVFFVDAADKYEPVQPEEPEQP